MGLTNSVPQPAPPPVATPIVGGTPGSGTPTPPVEGAHGNPPNQPTVLSPELAAASIASLVTTLSQSADRDQGVIVTRLLREFNDDGVLDKGEFEASTGLSLTTEAWDALIGSAQGGIQRREGHGGFVITDLAHLSHYLDQFEHYSRATSVSFQRFSNWTNISIVSRVELINHMLRLTEDNIAALARGANADALIRFLGGNYPIPQHLSRAEKQDQVENILLQLQRQAAGSGPTAAVASQRLMYVGLIVMDSISDAAVDGNIDLASLNEPATDPIVARHFMATIFDGNVGTRVTGEDGQVSYQYAPSEITGDQIGQVQEFASQVTQLRELFTTGARTIDGRPVLDYINDLNPNYATAAGVNPFTQVLELVARGPSEGQSQTAFQTEVLGALGACRSMNETAPPPPGPTTGSDADGHATPITPPVIQSSADVPIAPAQPEGEQPADEAPPAPVTPPDVPNYGYPPGQQLGQPVTAVV